LDGILYTLWLSLIYGVGPHRQRALTDHFGSAEAVYKAADNQLAAAPGLNEANIQAVISSRKKLGEAERVMAESEQKGIRIVTLDDREYPSLLKQIHDPPIVLYVSGTLPDDNLKKVGIIGARRCTEYGRAVTRELSKNLAERNVVVVSGMARGIDSVAHKGALEGGGQTIAVFGCGADICYPPESAQLMENIKLHGCVVTEFPVGTQPQPGNFPARNRIISGLSHVLTVTEAAKRSGTLITVNEALEQGREVMAVPGSIFSRMSDGPNELIRDGAGMVTSYQDILHTLNITEREFVQPIAPEELAPDEMLVYGCLSANPENFENIVDKCGLSAQNVNYILTMLELKGYLLKLPGQRYSRP